LHIAQIRGLSAEYPFEKEVGDTTCLINVGQCKLPPICGVALHSIGKNLYLKSHPGFAFKPDLLLTLRRGRDLMHR